MQRTDMRKWVNTRHCLGGVHCNACRNDAEWRATMAKSFIMPDKCPYPNRAKWIVPPEAQAICDACDGKNCPNVGCVSCGGETHLNIQYPCPRGLWTMSKE